jgi:hypothetical protein
MTEKSVRKLVSFELEEDFAVEREVGVEEGVSKRSPVLARAGTPGG